MCVYGKRGVGWGGSPVFSLCELHRGRAGAASDVYNFQSFEMYP